jgi:hypothetical protein
MQPALLIWADIGLTSPDSLAEPNGAQARASKEAQRRIMVMSEESSRVQGQTLAVAPALSGDHHL